MSKHVSAKSPDLSSSLSGARSLLGWELIVESQAGTTSGYIVETEAYDMDDPASHAFGGPDKRNAAMFEAAGTVYVYFTYGMHYCMNIVTGEKGHGQGVLIRALQPVRGISLMKKRRAIDDQLLLTNGPAKLTQAMGVDRKHGGIALGGGSVSLHSGLDVAEVVQTTRVGISKAVDQPWRFYIAGNPYVSRR